MLIAGQCHTVGAFSNWSRFFSLLPYLNEITLSPANTPFRHLAIFIVPLLKTVLEYSYKKDAPGRRNPLPQQDAVCFSSLVPTKF